MSKLDLARLRLQNQHIAAHHASTPGDVVRWLGAVQAQDYLAGLWAVGLRTQNVTEATVEQAITDRTIIRTWPMRGTLHFVAAEDIRWILQLLTPRVIARSASRYRQLELDDATFARSADLWTQALSGGKQLSRPAMLQVLETAGISNAGQRGIHMLGYQCQQGLLCLAAREGKQPTFALLDEWAPNTKTLPRDEALAELTLRYFTSHGPATVQDFVWWTGLTVTDARAGLEASKSQLTHIKVNDQTYWLSPDVEPDDSPTSSLYLLPPFDEYLLGYTERSAALDPKDATKIQPGANGIFAPIMVVDGQVVGTWKRVIKKKSVHLIPYPFTTLTEAEHNAFVTAAHQYAHFLGLPATVA